MKILIIGHARHGKDTLAQMMSDIYGFTFKSSSVAASEIFLYDALKTRYGYSSPQECFEDRVNHRVEWHDLICDYNKDDKARLAKDILINNDIYVGMRSHEEIAACKDEGLFDLIIGIYDPRKPMESKYSFDIDFWKECDIVIPNAGSIEDLRLKILNIYPWAQTLVDKVLS